MDEITKFKKTVRDLKRIAFEKSKKDGKDVRVEFEFDANII